MLSLPRKVIAYCQHNPDKIAAHLGEPDYSYAFVLQKFLPVLNSLGPVQVCHDLDGIEAACRQAQAQRRQPILFSFTPPHRLPVANTCMTVPVFAWEFDRIPDEVWNDDPRQNWAATLALHPGCITHSQFTVAAVRQSLGNDYRICSLPAPVWDKFAGLQDTTWTGEPQTIHFTGALVDSNRFRLNHECKFDPVVFDTGVQALTLSDFVLTTILNPDDGRKNWRDQITAFVWTFRDDPRATLVLKLIHHKPERVCGDVLLELRKIAPFRCRIVALHGYLDDQAFTELIRATTFIVNASRGEGQCLPLMEFMSAGKPAIAPTHTAMADYIHTNNAFFVRTSPEWTYWPHDTRRKLRCLSERLDWDSLCEAFREASLTCRENPDLYASMGKSASRTLKRHCSQAVIGHALNQFLAEIESASQRVKAN